MFCPECGEPVDPAPLTVVAARRGHGSPQDSKSARWVKVLRAGRSSRTQAAVRLPSCSNHKTTNTERN
jgi:hypothetical protein